jgi:hypothetical protein
MQLRRKAIAAARAAAVVAALAVGAGIPLGASASGAVLIQRAGQNPTTYSDAKVQIIHNTLNITSPDGKGTLIITRAACAYQGEILACLPTGVTLVQSGEVHALDLKTGMVYANMTDTTQQLSHSSMQLPPDGVMMTLQTQIGTFINLTGTIDKVTK